jgi:hypothetical protein
MWFYVRLIWNRHYVRKYIFSSKKISFSIKIISLAEIHISCPETTWCKISSRTVFVYVSGLKLDIQGDSYLENTFEFLSVRR